LGDNDCLFCRIAAGEIPAKSVRSDDETFAFRDIDPKAPTHVLVVPRRHIASVNDLTETDHELIGRLFTAAREIAAAEGIAESGYRLVMNTGPQAGQSVAHIHLHLLGGRRFTWPPG
jgi:histidine triad (HIT) family protein